MYQLYTFFKSSPFQPVVFVEYPIYFSKQCFTPFVSCILRVLHKLIPVSFLSVSFRENFKYPDLEFILKQTCEFLLYIKEIGRANAFSRLINLNVNLIFISVTKLHSILFCKMLSCFAKVSQKILMGLNYLKCAFLKQFLI